MTLDPPPPDVERILALRLRSRPLEYVDALDALYHKSMTLAELEQVVEAPSGLLKVLDWHRRHGLVKQGVDLQGRQRVYEITNLAALVLRQLSAIVGSTDRIPGPEACSQCGLRPGLGACSACRLRAMRGGPDGMHEWLLLAIHGLEGYLPNVDRERLVAWARGWAIDLDRIPDPQRPE